LTHFLLLLYEVSLILHLCNGSRLMFM
jgi:hypothetical protein